MRTQGTNIEVLRRHQQVGVQSPVLHQGLSVFVPTHTGGKAVNRHACTRRRQHHLEALRHAGASCRLHGHRLQTRCYRHHLLHAERLASQLQWRGHRRKAGPRQGHATSHPPSCTEERALHVYRLCGTAAKASKDTIAATIT